MPTIAPAQTNLRVMPTAAVPDAQLFTQVPNPAAGMQMFEQAAKLPLMFEQIKMEKMKMKAEKAKLDLAELQANYQQQNFEKLAAQQQALTDANLSIAQSNATTAAAAATPEALARRAAAEAAAADPVAIQRLKNAQTTGVPADMYAKTPEGLAAMDRDIGLNLAIADHNNKGGTLKTWVAQGGALPEAGIFGVKGATEEVAADTLPLSSEGTVPAGKALQFDVTGAAPTAATAPAPVVASTEYFAPALPVPNVPAGMKPMDRAILISQETGETPAEVYKRLDITDDKHNYVDPATGFKWQAVVTRDAEGNVYNRYAIQLDSGPKDPAAVRTRVATLEKARKQVANLKSQLEKGEFGDAFGVIDATTVGWLNDPTKAAPLRVAAGRVASDDAKKLSGELSVTAKFLQELAGSAMSAGEAKRYDPYVPGSTDLVLGKDMLVEKMTRFERMMGEEEAALLQSFPNLERGVRQTGSPQTPSAPAGVSDILTKSRERTQQALEAYNRSRA